MSSREKFTVKCISCLVDLASYKPFSSLCYLISSRRQKILFGYKPFVEQVLEYA